MPHKSCFTGAWKLRPPVWVLFGKRVFADVGLVEVQPARRALEEHLFGRLIQNYHYLGYTHPVGEQTQNGAKTMKLIKLKTLFGMLIMPLALLAVIGNHAYANQITYTVVLDHTNEGTITISSDTPPNSTLVFELLNMTPPSTYHLILGCPVDPNHTADGDPYYIWSETQISTYPSQRSTGEKTATGGFCTPEGPVNIPFFAATLISLVLLRRKVPSKGIQALSQP